MAFNPELQKTVVDFVVVKRPLNTKRPDQKSGYKITHEGCVVTTVDGQKYLIEKGVAPDGMDELYRHGGDQGSRIVKLGHQLPLGFEIVKKVDVKVKNVTLMQLVEASGKDYNWLCNNCWNSTDTMKQAVTGQLQLPWQLDVATKVEIVALFAMALLVFGRLVLSSARTS